MEKRNLTTEKKNNIISVQNVLMNIRQKRNCFFNVQQYINMGLIKEHGKTIDNKTNWILTTKGNMILDIVL